MRGTQPHAVFTHLRVWEQSNLAIKKAINLLESDDAGTTVFQNFNDKVNF